MCHLGFLITINKWFLIILVGICPFRYFLIKYMCLEVPCIQLRHLQYTNIERFLVCIKASSAHKYWEILSTPLRYFWYAYIERFLVFNWDYFTIQILWVPCMHLRHLQYTYIERFLYAIQTSSQVHCMALRHLKYMCVCVCMVREREFLYAINSSK